MRVADALVLNLMSHYFVFVGLLMQFEHAYPGFNDCKIFTVLTSDFLQPDFDAQRSRSASQQET